MITLNITIGGNLLIELNKGAKEDLKELINNSNNTDKIISDLLDVSGYLGNDWHEPSYIGLTEAPSIGYGAIYNDTENDEVSAEDYEKVWYYPDYMLKSFAEELLENKKVIFKKL